ncbi:MAG: alpha/beta hydrolase fold domain-containing protein [Burkholderiaceae bacterium]
MTSIPIDDSEQPTPEMRVTLARIAELREGQGDRYTMPFDESRAQLLRERRWWLEEAPAMAAIEESSYPSADRSVRVRRYVPVGAEQDVEIVYLHGGGWCVGSLDTHDGIMRRLAVAARCPVSGIAYALAPEHPYPAAADDVRQALAALRSERSSVARWVLAGDSAGANLALAEAIRARDAGESTPQSLLLFYGVYLPVRESASMRAFADGRFGLSRAAMQRYETAYLGGRTPADAASAFPLIGGALHGLPPAWVAAAGLDPLRDDSLELVEALRAAGTAAQLRVYEGIVHGFLSYARLLPAAVEAIDEAAVFARQSR